MMCSYDCMFCLQMVNLKRLLKTPKSDWNNETITRHNHIEILPVIDDVLTGIDDGGSKSKGSWTHVLDISYVCIEPCSFLGQLCIACFYGRYITMAA